MIGLSLMLPDMVGNSNDANYRTTLPARAYPTTCNGRAWGGQKRWLGACRSGWPAERMRAAMTRRKRYRREIIAIAIVLAVLVVAAAIDLLL